MEKIIDLIKHPFFVIGLIAKILLISFFLPDPVFNWYLPFLDYTSGNVSLDPWSIWLSSNGTVDAFPYGYSMWFFFLPFILVTKLLNLPIFLAYVLGILFADIAVLFLFSILIINKRDYLIYFYWLSPIVIFGSYTYGFNDLIPLFFLMISILSIKKLKFLMAGIFLTLAFSSKLSMIVILPIYLIYLINSNSLRKFIGQFLLGILLGTIFFILPTLISDGYIKMLFSNPELQKIYDLKIPLTDSLNIYLLPLAYLIVLYLCWKIKRMNFDLFFTTIGIALTIIVIFTPASTGWYLWTLPLFVFFHSRTNTKSLVLYLIFSGLYILISFINEVGLSAVIVNIQIESILYTMIFGVGLVMIYRIWNEIVLLNDFFQLSRKPYVIGISGVHGSGKQTLVSSLSGVFGSHSVAQLSSKNYYFWDKSNAIWKGITYLNPISVDLEKFSKDLINLINGKNINGKKYDHVEGFTERNSKIYSNDFIFVEGMHSLYLPILRSCYNLSIFLDIDTNLREFLLRNQKEHNEETYYSPNKSEEETKKYIHNQAQFSDLILKLMPTNADQLKVASSINDIKFKVRALYPKGMNDYKLIRVLTGVCGLYVESNFISTSEIEITIEGDVSSEDIEMGFHELCPHMVEFIDIEPQWKSGMNGVIQLVVLSFINQTLLRNFL